MSAPCQVHDCREESDGALVHVGVRLAAICDPHAHALGTDRVHLDGGGTLYPLNPERSRGWRLFMRLDRPSPTLYMPGETHPDQP